VQRPVECFRKWPSLSKPCLLHIDNTDSAQASTDSAPASKKHQATVAAPNEVVARTDGFYDSRWRSVIDFEVLHSA
jgi:hypothetical protein